MVLHCGPVVYRAVIQYFPIDCQNGYTKIRDWNEVEDRVYQAVIARLAERIDPDIVVDKLSHVVQPGVKGSNLYVLFTVILECQDEHRKQQEDAEVIQEQLAPEAHLFYHWTRFHSPK